MTNQNIIADKEPLQPEYIPSEFISREQTVSKLDNFLREGSSKNIHLEGPHGTGKTHLIQSILEQLPTKDNTCFIDCRQADTQYKALKQIYKSLTQEKINSGHHTSDLQRKVEEKTGTLPTVIVLDEIDFLLLNDGEDLLYYLSRIDTQSQISIVTISNQNQDLEDQVEERTYSSLQPYTVEAESYTEEETRQILYRRAQDSLNSQSLHREALTHISSETNNIRFGIQWLKTAANETNSVITETRIQNTQHQAIEAYVEQLLDRFTHQHRILYQAIKNLSDRDVVQAGDVYCQYRQTCRKRSIESLSNRRISTYLKHLELLQLIQAEYHYGGKTGKTRKIKLLEPYQNR